MAEIITCSPRYLPREKWVEAARTAVNINPLNHAPVERLAAVIPGFKPLPEHLAVVVTKYWQTHQVNLTVSFMDNPPADLRKRILEHMGLPAQVPAAWPTRSWSATLPAPRLTPMWCLPRRR